LNGSPVVSEIYEFSTDNEAIDIHDLTDGAGHGILVATDNIWLTGQLIVAAPGGISVIASGVVFCDIFYRFKKVTLQEYIGIVQSQQSG
jgi:hypothetical protein